MLQIILALTSDLDLYRYCVLGDLIAMCPEGYYCPSGTGINWQPCPRGTYNDDTGLSGELECRQCPGGYYCGEMAQTDYITPCDPGKSVRSQGG